MRIAIVSLLLTGCICRLDPCLDPQEDHPSCNEPCDAPQEHYTSCVGCHANAGTAEGWYEDDWGREAYFTLFTESRSELIPEHAEPYEFAEMCFCRREPDRPFECLSIEPTN